MKSQADSVAHVVTFSGLQHGASTLFGVKRVEEVVSGSPCQVAVLRLSSPSTWSLLILALDSDLLMV